jgi:hypothetical protein
VPVAERRERAILHLEAEIGEERADVVRCAPVSLGADEPVAGRDELLHVCDRPRAADTCAQLVFGRREHGAIVRPPPADRQATLTEFDDANARRSSRSLGEGVGDAPEGG